MGRSPCCEKVGLKKGPWVPEEDQKLLAYIELHGHGSWRALPSKAGLQRCGKSCRLRWTNYLRPDIKRGKFSLHEEQTIIQLHALLGNRWSAIATHLPKRTDNEIKNHWNTHLKKRLAKMGIDPMTHKPKSDTLSNNAGNTKDAANLSHMAQWESARLEAEARLVRESSKPVPQPQPNQLGSSASATAATAAANSAYNNNKTVGATSAPTAPPTPISIPPCLDVLKAWQGAWFKSNSVSGGYFTGDLESPTSTLNFSAVNNNKSAAAAPPATLMMNPAVQFVSNNSSIAGAAIMNNISGGSFEKLNDYGSTEGVLWMNYGNDDVLSSFNGGEGGLNDILLIENSDDHKTSDGGDNSDHGRDFEDHKDYWSGILDLVNAAMPDSPVF